MPGNLDVPDRGRMRRAAMLTLWIEHGAIIDLERVDIP
jgi:hypothetical protein